MNNPKQLQLLYILNFLKDTNLIHVVLSPFMIFSDLSISDYIMLIGLFRLVQVFFSIPAGIMADKYKPSFSLRLSAILFMISFLFLLDPKPSLMMFAMHNIISSLSICLMISSNKKLKYIVSDKEMFIEKYSQKISIRKLGLMVSGITASLFIAALGYRGLVLVQILFTFVLVYISFKLKEDVIDTELSSAFKLRSIGGIINSIKELPAKEMAQVVVVSVPFFVSLDVMLQPLMIEAKVPLWLFPLIIALSNLLIFVAINKSSFFSKFFNTNIIVKSLMPLTCLAVYVLTDNPIFGLVGMVITILSRCFSVVESALFINQISPRKQSTIESVLNTLNIVGVSLMSFIYGALVKFTDLWTASCLFLFVMILFVVILQIYIHKKDNKINNL